MRKNIKKVFRDYRVPIIGTLVFLLCLSGLLFIRYQERIAVVGLTKDNPLINSGKSRLISKDQALALTQNNQTAAAESTKQTASGGGAAAANQTSAAVGSSTTSSGGGGVTTGGGTSTPPDATGGGNELPPSPPPSDPFSIDIINLDHHSFMGPSSGSTSSCTIMHEFIGVIRGSNGPGSFTYHWEQMNGQRSGDFVQNAGPGESYFEVRHNWPISSPYGSSFNAWVKLVVNIPGYEDKKIDFKHQC